MLEKNEGTINNGQSRITGKIGYTQHKTRTNKTKTQRNMCWTPLYVNNVRQAVHLVGLLAKNSFRLTILSDLKLNRDQQRTTLHVKRVGMLSRVDGTIVTGQGLTVHRPYQTHILWLLIWKQLSLCTKHTCIIFYIFNQCAKYMQTLYVIKLLRK